MKKIKRRKKNPPKNVQMNLMNLINLMNLMNLLKQLKKWTKI